MGTLPAVTEGLPESIALRLDPGTRRTGGGRTLIGGSPLRVMRLSDVGSHIVDDLLSGAVVGSDRTRRALARRLLDAGMAHPVGAGSPLAPASVTVVVPVKDGADGVSALLDRIGSDSDWAPDDVIVVDDGSTDEDGLVRAVAGRASIIRHDRSRGPAAARNTGWRAARSEIVVFIDADVTPRAGWLGPLLDHLADPAVTIVAPRVSSAAGGGSVLDRYEAHRSPLDLGSSPARVVPRGRVSYVPSAALVCRRRTLDALGGFDESLRFGEDVDLVWRACAAGETVRYEPAAVVEHANRTSWGALVRQRVQYGSSAAALDRRHPGQVPPVELNVWSLLAWVLAAVGGRRGIATGVVVAAASSAALVPKLRDHVDDPVEEAARLAGLGNLWAGRWLAGAVTRAWLPITVAASTASKRIRRVLLIALVVPPLLEWMQRHPDLDPPRWVAIRAVDDAAYCAGLWRGCVHQRSWRALAPRLSGIPELSDR